MPWLQLIRWQNLLIIFLTQLLAWWCVVLPEQPRVLNLFNFILLSLSTILIAAAGYIINDYFDIKIDTINKPGKVVLEKIIPRKQAIIAHAVLNSIALVLAGIVCAAARHYEWLLLQLSCTVLLWFYSTHLKRQYITGNIAVAMLTALTIIALFIYEPVMQHLAHLPIGRPSLPVIILAVLTYFAFMLTWVREIVKDMEDIKGDEADGCVTMPVIMGLKYARNFALVLSALVIAPLAALAGRLYYDRFSVLSVYFGLIVVAIIFWGVFLHTGSPNAKHYHTASSGLKLIMLLGVCSLVIYHFQLL